jgi:ribosome-binding factor A
MANPRTIARIEAAIQRRAAHCLQHEISDPRGQFITIVRVELNSDLSVAKLFYSVLGSSSERSQAAQMLEHATGFIRKQVGRVLETRSIPVLRFLEDTTASDAEQMDDMITKALHRDRQIRSQDEVSAEASAQAAPPQGDAPEGAAAEEAPSDPEPGPTPS